MLASLSTETRLFSVSPSIFLVVTVLSTCKVRLSPKSILESINITAKQTIAPEVDQLEEKDATRRRQTAHPFPDVSPTRLEVETVAVCEPVNLDSPQKQASQVTCSHLYTGEKELAGESATQTEPSSLWPRVSSQVQIAVLRLVPPEIWT